MMGVHMRKLLLAGFIAALIAAPFAGSAHQKDIEDARDCAASAGPASVVLGVQDDDPMAPDADNADRGSVCVKDADGGTLLYVGGEIQADNAGEETGVACGAAIVAGTTVAGEDTKDFNHGDGHNHCE